MMVPGEKFHQPMSKKKRFTILIVAAGLLVVAGSTPIVFQQILVQWYLWKLESTDEEARRAAAEKLGQLRSTRAVQPLARILQQEAGKPPPLHYSAVSEQHEIHGELLSCTGVSRSP